MNQFPKDECGWPQEKLDESLLTGANECGRDLYMFGSFGGFGGCFVGPVFKDIFMAHEWYKWNEEAMKKTASWSLYRISVNLCMEYEDLKLVNKNGDGQ